MLTILQTPAYILHQLEKNVTTLFAVKHQHDSPPSSVFHMGVTKHGTDDYDLFMMNGPHDTDERLEFRHIKSLERIKKEDDIDVWSILKKISPDHMLMPHQTFVLTGLTWQMADTLLSVVQQAAAVKHFQAKQNEYIAYAQTIAKKNTAKAQPSMQDKAPVLDGFAEPPENGGSEFHLFVPC